MDYDEDGMESGQDFEPDSDAEDPESESQLSQWLGELENYAKGLDPGDTGTVKRRQKTVVTPKMAMESFRYSFLSENHDVNFDAILGELCELEHQLGSAQSEPSFHHHSNCLSSGLMREETRSSGNDLVQSELDALASEITQSLGYTKHKRQMGDLDYFQTHYPGDLGGYSDAMLDIAETDSAFSESASLPSSESFTSMATVSSSAENAGMGDGSQGNSAVTPQGLQCDEDQRARIQAEKIRIALEKIKEAKIKKLFVRAFASDGSSKSIMVDEKMTILQVIAVLADKNHVRLNPDVAVIEHMPELYMERVLEDHDSLVENMVMWTRDTVNKILFEARPLKNDLFKAPERYLLVSSASEKGASMDPKRREHLIQDFFSHGGSQVPEVEGVLYLKSDGKKAWKKFYFVLRASGLYYNPKGKVSKGVKDLSCLVQFEFVELYNGLGWKKKYHAPTDYCFALKHPQIQKKTSKFIRYLCAENKAALDQWIMGIRIAKFGKQLVTNFQNLQREILTWDSRDLRTSLTDQSEALSALNQEDLGDSRLSMPEPGSRHSIVNIKGTPVLRDSSVSSRNSDDTLCGEIDQSNRTPERKSSLTIVHGNIEHARMSEKVPVKRVSFSNTHSVIHDSGEEVVPLRHRDSITSASTDSSEDSTSSGEGRMSIAHRGSKLRAKLPVTTGTTKQISEMVQTSMDGGSVGSYEEEWRPSVSSPVQKEFNERRRSAPACSGNEHYGDKKYEGNRDHRAVSHSVQYEHLPMSPTSQHSHYPREMSRGVMSPPMQKGIKGHSRGSSISSIESSDSGSGLGYTMSPSSPTPAFFYQDPSQPSWSLYESLDGHQVKCQGQPIKQGPPTAQKPSVGKKVRPQSVSSIGQGSEKGHKRNSSKSSLESVEEVPRETDSISSMHIPEMAPITPRTAMMSPPPQGAVRPSGPLLRPLSQTSTPPAMSMSAPPPLFTSQATSQPPHVINPIMHQSTPPPNQQYSTSPSPSPGDQTYGHLGCMSPKLTGHRIVGPKPVQPPSAPCTPSTPPALVPPAPRNPAQVKTHKKRPSGGNIVVNGNQVMSRSEGSSYPDIATSAPKSPLVKSNDHQHSVISGLPGNQSGQAQQGANQEEASYAPLPFMAELNKHMHKAHTDIVVGGPMGDNRLPPPETLPKPIDTTKDKAHTRTLSSSHNEYLLSSNQNHSYVGHSNIDEGVYGSAKQTPLHAGKKTAPPPPPKRSGSTKLSSNSRTGPEDSANVPNSNSQTSSVEPAAFNSCEGIVDINDLPPPPPELLEGYSDEVKGQGVQGQGSLPPTTGKMKPPPPPPPPKRSHLSSSSS